jgi:hypothetical protein
MESDTEKVERMIRDNKLARMYPIRMSACRNETAAEERRLKAHDERIRRAKAKKRAKY